MLIAFEQAVVVDVYASGQLGVIVALHFDVEQDPEGVAVDQPDFGDFVCPTTTYFGFGHQLLQFFVEKFDGFCPIDAGVKFGEEEFQKLGKVVFNDLFPGAVVVGALFGHGWYLDQYKYTITLTKQFSQCHILKCSG